MRRLPRNPWLRKSGLPIEVPAPAAKVAELARHLTQMEFLRWAGIMSSWSVSAREPNRLLAYEGIGRPPRLLEPDRKHQPEVGQTTRRSLAADTRKR